jgi:hypothetical protein
MRPPSPREAAREHESELVEGLVTTIRASIRLRDGYYLSEELVDLYLVGVLRGVAVGLLDADGRYGGDEMARNMRLDELARTSAELLDHLHRLRPAPAQAGPAPEPRRPEAQVSSG